LAGQVLADVLFRRLVGIVLFSWQKVARLDHQKPRGDDQEIGQVGSRQFAEQGDVRQVLISDNSEGHARDVQFLALDEAQEHVQRALVDVDGDSVRRDGGLRSGRQGRTDCRQRGRWRPPRCGAKAHAFVQSQADGRANAARRRPAGGLKQCRASSDRFLTTDAP